MLVDTEIQGLQKAMDLLDISEDIDEIAHQTLLKSAENIVNEARSNLQNNTNINSGTLLSSIKILFDDGESVYVGSDSPYAGHIEFGRGPVYPKNPDGVLVWVDKKTGKKVFSKSAKATEPSPFLTPAVLSETAKFPDLMVSEFDTKLRSV